MGGEGCDRLVILYAAGEGNKWGVGWEVFGEGLEVRVIIAFLNLRRPDLYHLF